mgnify:FL=1
MHEITDPPSKVLAQLLFICFVPSSVATYISQPTLKVVTRVVTVRSESACNKEVIVETEWPDGRRTCLYKKLPYGSVVTNQSPKNGDYLKKEY